MIAKLTRILWALMCRAVLILACLAFFLSVFGLLARYPYLGLVIAVGTAWQRCRRGFGSFWHHGTASMADWRSLMAGNCLADQGLILGTAAFIDRPTRRFAFVKLLTAPLKESVLAVRLFLAAIWGPRWTSDCPIRVKDSVHLATFAKTRGGKGVSVVIPILLSHKESMVCTDPKTENFKKTAKHRRRKLGHRIVRLEPFGKDSDTFNPLDGIDHNSPDFIDACRDLAAALILRTGKEHELHFIDSAERMLVAIIALVCVISPPELRNLQTVRELLASREKYAAAIKLMQESGDVAGGMLQRLGHAQSAHEGREFSSVLSTVHRMTGWLDSPLIAANVSKSSFDPKELKNGKMTIYLCLPPERLTSHAPILRMWISSIMRAITVDGDESRQTLFMLDEVGNMGHLQILEDAVTMYSGMGIRLWFIFQSLDQVKTVFGERANTFLDNIGTQQFFSIQSYSTAEDISRRLGETTVITESEQTGTSDSTSYGGGPQSGTNSGNRSKSRSLTTSEMARKLLKPEEITTMHTDMSIIFHHANPPILARRIKYYNSPLFRTLLPERFRSGGTPGLGLSGGIASVAVLLAALLLAGLLASLPTVRLQQRPARAYPSGPGGYPYPSSFGSPYRVNGR